MNLLFSNDRRGEFPNSWYAATATPPLPFSPLRGRDTATVCVIGGGFTGLSTALHLASAGVDVVVLEAHRVGFGASGRNGGQVGSGQRLEQTDLEKMMGDADATALWQLGEDAKAKIDDLCASHGIDCDYRPGVVHADCHARDVPHAHAYAKHLHDRYGYDRIDLLDREGLRAMVDSPAYHGGYVDWGAGHLHPLKLAFGLARAAVTAGARIHEGTWVHDIQTGTRPLVRTDMGSIECDHVVLATNGYMGRLNDQVAARVMPINNFIVATKPLTEPQEQVLKQDVAVADSKFVVNYFRLSDDKRLLFGGGETYGYRFPRDIAALVRKPMSQIFPQLADVAIEYAWGGTLAITRNRLPCFMRPARGVWSASGYSGHGVALAVLAGDIIAEAISGDSTRFDLMARVPQPRFPGGTGLRSPLLAGAMTWFSLRDRLGL